MQGLSARAVHFASAIGIGAVIIAALTVVLSAYPSEWTRTAGDFLLDLSRSTYPVTVQNLMWIVFAIAMGELTWRVREANVEARQTRMELFPEDPSVILQRGDLPPVYRKLRNTGDTDSTFLHRLGFRCIRQFQTSGSITDASNVFNSSMELFQHELDLRYNIARYLTWLIPTLGFIGTVMGIVFALNGTAAFAAAAGSGASVGLQDPQLMVQLTDKLGVAFYTTLLALIMSAILVLMMHVVQEREERSLNAVGQYCLDNLLNRLYEEE